MGNNNNRVKHHYHLPKRVNDIEGQKSFYPDSV